MVYDILYALLYRYVVLPNARLRRGKYWPVSWRCGVFLVDGHPTLFANPSHVASFLSAPFSSCSCALGCLRTPSRSPPCRVNNGNEVRLACSQVHLLIFLSQGSGMLTSLCNSSASEVADCGRIWYLRGSNSTSRRSLTEEFSHCFCGCKNRGVPYVDPILP